MWSQQADPPSPGGLCTEGSCSRLHFVERTFRNLCSRSFPPHYKTGRNPTSQVFHCGSETFSAKSPKTCLSTRAVAVTTSLVAGRAQSSPLLLGATWTGLLTWAFSVFTWGLILCVSLMFSNFFFYNFFIQKQCNKWHFCGPRGPMNEPELRAHVLRCL